METPSFYAIIPAHVRYANIKANAKLLYGEITALADKTGECWASNEYFSKLYGVSVKQVSLWVKELVDHNFIVSDVRKSEGNKRFIAIHQKVHSYTPKGVDPYTPKGSYINTSNINTSIISSKEDSKTLVSEENEEYGNKDINLMLTHLKLAVGLDDFKDPAKWQRIYASHLVKLRDSIGIDEFKLRLKGILSDGFKRKNCTKLEFLWGEMKAFIHSPMIEAQDNTKVKIFKI